MTTPNQSLLVKLTTYGAFLSFFLFGFVDNLKGPTLPVLLDDLGFGYLSGGALVMGAYVGFLVATLCTGPMSDALGRKTVVLIASAWLLVGIVGYSVSSALWVLATAMGVVGLGLGTLEVGGNLIVVDLHRQDKGRFLNLLAFFYGAGSMVAPLYAGQLLDTGISWRRIYQSGLLLVVLLCVYFLLVRYPRAGASASTKPDMCGLGRSALAGEMVLYYAAIAIYVAAEIGIGAWLVEFLQTAKSQSVMTSSLFLSLFFGAITVGRLVGSCLVERAGYVESMLWASVAAIACVAIGTFAPPAVSVFLPIAGLFFSIIFPTITAAVSDLHKENVGTVLGLLFTCAGLGGMLGPWAVGIVGDWMGIRIGFGMVLVFCICLAGLLAVLAARQVRAGRVS